MVQHSHSILLTRQHVYMHGVYVCTLGGCDGKRICTFPSFPLTLSQHHSRHPHFEACACKIHKHTHTRGGNSIQTTAFSTAGRIPRVWREDRIKEKEKRGEKASNLTSSDPFTHTHAFGGATLSGWDSCGIVTSSLVARRCI